MATQRNLVIAEAASQVKLLVCDHTLTSTASFLFNTVSEIFVGEDALVDVYTIQNHHNQSTSINSAFYKQERNSNLVTGTVSLHGGLIRNNLKVTFNGEHAEANINGISFTDKKQHVDNFTVIEHASPNCLSNQVYKNILDDESTGAICRPHSCGTRCAANYCFPAKQQCIACRIKRKDANQTAVNY